MRRPVAFLLFFALALPLAGVPATTARAQRYRFIVTGDGRSALHDARPDSDSNGVDTTAMKALVREMLRTRPRFVLFNGDLVYGYTSEDSFRTQLIGWRELMRPVYQAGIHVYLIRGNHDASSVNADQVWDEVFTGPYVQPSNGPEGEKDMTFAAREENALIVGLDQWNGHEHAVNEKWLDQQLARNTLPVVLVMGHEMAFRAGVHTDNLAEHRRRRDRFIEALFKAGARVYFAGHDHFYDHAEITDPKCHPGLDIHQFVVGTAGAPFYHGADYGENDGSWTVIHKPEWHIERAIGYMLGEVDSLDVKLTFFGRTAADSTFRPMDSFAYRAARAEAPTPSRTR